MNQTHPSLRALDERIKHTRHCETLMNESNTPVIASLRSNPESDRCTWIASQARNDDTIAPTNDEV